MECTTAFDAEGKIQKVLYSNCDNSNIITSNDRGIFLLITALSHHPSLRYTLRVPGRHD